MTLYAADVMDLAKPVETKKSKGKKKEVLPTPPVSEPEQEKQEKPKRVLSEKQLAALEKAKETRKRKREEAIAAKAAEEDAIKKKQEEILAKEAELTAKKEAAKEKRRLKRESKEIDKQLDEAVESVVKKPKMEKKVDETAPVWFQKYVEGVKKEQARMEKEKKPAKQIQQEASEVAQNKWGDGLVRDRLRNEVDGHMNRMYSMIFGGRSLR